MIADSILAAIEARLLSVFTPPPLRYRPFLIDATPLGLIDDARAECLARFDCFDVTPQAVHLDPALGSCETRSAALADVALALRNDGALPAWRDELYAVAGEFGAAPVALIERGAARYFGVRTWAMHVNGIVRNGASTSMWLARRSCDKAVDPGLLDNLVGGGIAAGLRIDDTLVKESWEEAGIPEALARSARAAGVVHVRQALSDGLQRETVFVHDLALPADFVPANQDGEAVEHRLAMIDDAARAVACATGPNQVTVDASVVILDYLFRHGEILPGQPSFPALRELLRRPAG